MFDVVDMYSPTIDDNSVAGPKITCKGANGVLRIGFLYDRQVFKYMKLGDFVRSADLKMLNLILLQKAVSCFCADTAKHLAHLLHIDHIRVLPEDQLICFIAFQQNITPSLLKK